jgi:hypothetical protein
MEPPAIQNLFPLFFTTHPIPTMPLFSRKRSAFSFKRDANGAYDIKDDKSAHRDFKFTSNPFMGTSMVRRRSCLLVVQPQVSILLLVRLLICSPH